MLRHTPVLLHEVLSFLPPTWGVVLDGTLGHGGHTQAMLQQAHTTGVSLHVVGVDKDLQMIAKAKDFLGSEQDKVTIVQGSYADFSKIVEQSGVHQFDFMLLDLGVNMDHFKVAERWFSIKLDGELDMRYDTTQGVPVSQRLTTASREELLHARETYTDFWPKYRDWMTDELLQARKTQTFHTTQEFRTWAHGLGINDKHLAVLFQAMRITVNDELGELEKFLQLFTSFLIPWGKCCIITYHSIEDRIVKYACKELEEQWRIHLVNKKVIKPTWQETQKNKAARSAKMRVVQRSR